jgi:hypothetical protein
MTIHEETYLRNPEVSMRGMGHRDPIATVHVTHQEGNEGKKIGVKRRNRAFYGAKLLKRQGDGWQSERALACTEKGC